MADHQKEKVTIYCDMVADLFHWGHVRFLKNARFLAPKILRQQLQELGLPVPSEDAEIEVVVGIHNDADVAAYKRSPVMNMEERIEVIEAIKYVDRAIPNAPLQVTPAFLEKHHFDAVCHAHKPEENDRYAFMYDCVPKGRFIRLEPSPVTTTDVIGRIQTRTADKTLADHSGSDTEKKSA